jgi:hypothetical protein
VLGAPTGWCGCCTVAQKEQQTGQPQAANVMALATVPAPASFLPLLQGVVYITDDSGKHEITSWRLEEASCAPRVPAPEGGKLGGAHVVVVVDHSGSMRKEDVPGCVGSTFLGCCVLCTQPALLSNGTQPSYCTLAGGPVACSNIARLPLRLARMAPMHMHHRSSSTTPAPPRHRSSTQHFATAGRTARAACRRRQAPRTQELCCGQAQRYLLLHYCV